MRSGVLLGASLIAGAFAIVSARPAAAEIVIRVDKETQTMTVTVDRHVMYVWPVSTGMAGRDTPSGTFQPNRMDADHHSQEWDNAPMPYTIFFDMHGHAVHGFASITHLGNPASHGCVRLAPQNASILFDLVKMEKMHDTTVIVTGQTPSLQSLAALRRHDMIAANAPLTRESLTHRSSDQAQPYGAQTNASIKEAAAYQLPQTDAFEKLIPTPTFAMSGARWTRRPTAAQLAAYVVPAPPAEPKPLPHAGDRQQHDAAAVDRRRGATEMRTAVNEQPPARLESLQAEAKQTPVASELPLPHAAEEQQHRPANNGRRQAAAELETALNEQPAGGEPLNPRALQSPAASETPLQHAAEDQPHRPATNGHRQAAAKLDTAVNEQPAEGEPLERQTPEALAGSEPPPQTYNRLQSYAMPPVLPRSERLPTGYRQQQQPRAYAQTYVYRQAGGYGPQYYYVLPPTDGRHVYYYVQPGYGYAQPVYAQPQYYQLYGQY